MNVEIAKYVAIFPAMVPAAGLDAAHPSRDAAPEDHRQGAYPARALGVAAAWVLGALPAATGLTRCPVALFTHHACPGCGLTRAVRLLFHGDVAGSLHMHALAVAVVASSGLIMLGTTWAAYRRGTPTDLLQVPFGRFAAWAFVVVQVTLLLYYVARLAGAFGGLPPV